MPQFLLDELMEREGCTGGQIIVTQPRRLAAISVADRVSKERGERIGESVGYQVRLDAKRPTTPCSILFCTTGILLRRMSSGANGLDGVVHIVVDEVHERDLNTDFLLVLVSRLVQLAPKLRVTLMSATLNAQLFADYFGRALQRQSGASKAAPVKVPILAVQGKMYPVREIFLEEALQHVDLRRCVAPPKRPAVKTLDGDEDELPEVSEQHLSQAASKADRHVADILRSTHCQSEELSPAAIAGIVTWLCMDDPLSDEGGGGGGAAGAGSGGEYRGMGSNAVDVAGAILVFLPGTQEIRDVEKALNEAPFRDVLAGSALVLQLHGSLSMEEQNRVFQRPPAGKRKVVLATNVAESSVTIDDVAYVVNSGKLKERRFNSATAVSSLQTHWASAANNKQRRGRAGRVRPGLAINLYVSQRSKRLKPFQTPEMRRVPLDELCLTLKTLGLGKAAPVLAEALEPPEADAVVAALESLRGVGALDSEEELTALGRSLGQLPLEPRVGKMLIMACALGVLEPALTIAACAAGRDPFFRPLHARDEADRAKKRLGGEKADGGGCSDHIVQINTFDQWSEVRHTDRERPWCEDHFVSWTSMNTISKTRDELRSTLVKCGLAVRGPRENLSHINKEHKMALVRAVLAGSMWPGVGLVAGSEKSFSKQGNHGHRLLLHAKNNMRLGIHPSSTVAGESQYHIGKLKVAMYQSKVMTKELYVDVVTLISPLTAILFGAEGKSYYPPASALHSAPQLEGHVGLVQDGWMATTMRADVAAKLQQLRSGIDKLIVEHVGEGGRGGGKGHALSEEGKEFVEAIGEFLVLEQGGGRYGNYREGGAGAASAAAAPSVRSRNGADWLPQQRGGGLPTGPGQHQYRSSADDSYGRAGGGGGGGRGGSDSRGSAGYSRQPAERNDRGFVRQPSSGYGYGQSGGGGGGYNARQAPPAGGGGYDARQPQGPPPGSVYNARQAPSSYGGFAGGGGGGSGRDGGQWRN